MSDRQQMIAHSRPGADTNHAIVGSPMRPDTIWMPFRFGEEPTNAITNDLFDPVTATAEYKCCAARIERLCPEHEPVRDAIGGPGPRTDSRK